MVAPGKVEALMNPAQAAAIERACERFGFDRPQRRGFLKQLEQADFETRELLLCAADAQYFICTYLQIYDAEYGDWIPFNLWPEQIEVLYIFLLHQLVAGLKARQVGITWLALAVALWQMLFAPMATVMIYSRRDDEAIYLLGEERLKGMYTRLPKWMQALGVAVDSAHQFKLSNGSVAYAFPTTAGDGYTATLVIADEADLLPDLARLLRMVKPTIDAGGKLFLISRANKDEPESLFKKIYKAARDGLNNYKSFFLSWRVRPGRTQAWYEQEKKAALAETGSLDRVHEQYPATDLEALAPSSANKRVPSDWLQRCYQEMQPLAELPNNAPNVPDMRVFKPPQPGRQYVIGADCAEGLPTSDDSVSVVVDALSGEEVALLVGKLTPAVHAALTVRMAIWYHSGGVMPENNNHGHAFVQWLTENGHEKLLLKGHNEKLGWTSNTLGKVLMYDAAAEFAKDADCLIRSSIVYEQLQSIEKATLLAPPNQMDDCADAWALAMVARHKKPAQSKGLVKHRVKNLWGQSPSARARR